MHVPSPHSSGLDFPFSETALHARHSFVWLLAFLQNRNRIYACVSLVAVVFRLPLWGSLLLVQTSPL